MILFLMLACNTPSPPASSAVGDEIPAGQTEDDFGPAPVFLLTD